MKDQKLIKKIFNLAYYDFNQNSTNLMTISGLQAILVTMFFCTLCFLLSDYAVTSWAWAPSVVSDFTQKLSALCLGDTLRWISTPVSLVAVIGMILLPLIIMQNCLDLAFDSAMSGFSVSIKGMLKSLMAMIFFVSGPFLAVGLALYGYNFLWLWLLRYVGAFFMLCIVYITLLIGLHALEYKFTAIKSLKDVFHMIQTKFVFLGKTFVIQCLITGSILFVFSFISKIIISFFTRVLVWPFTLLGVFVPAVFTIMIANFFYVWAYLLLCAWICLATAHVYRQLICPPVENASCPSCDSCEK